MKQWQPALVICVNCLPEAACQASWFLLVCLPQLAFQRRLTQSLHAQYCERRAYYAASTLGGGCACVRSCPGRGRSAHASSFISNPLRLKKRCPGFCAALPCPGCFAGTCAARRGTGTSPVLALSVPLPPPPAHPPTHPPQPQPQPPPPTHPPDSPCLGLTNADQRITEDVERFSHTISELYSYTFKP